MEFVLGIVRGGEWHPTIKENGLAAWVVVLGLLSAAGLSFWLAHRFSRRGSGTQYSSDSWSWYLSSLILLGLAACNQLELHYEFLGFLKGEAKHGGWYEYRYQIAGVISLVVLVFSSLFLWKTRHYLLKWLKTFAEMLGGIAIFVMIILLSMTSTHIIDHIFGWHFGCPRTDSHFETIAVGLILAGIFRNVRRLNVKTKSTPATFAPISRERLKN